MGFVDLALHSCAPCHAEKYAARNRPVVCGQCGGRMVLGGLRAKTSPAVRKAVSGRRATCMSCEHYGEHERPGGCVEGCGLLPKPCKIDLLRLDPKFTGPRGRECWEPIAPTPQAELPTSAESGPQILAKFHTPQPAPETRYQIIIKSLLRWVCVERLVRSIKRWYPTVEILIADDSFKKIPDKWPEEIERIIKIPGVTWYQLEHDCGLPAGRAFLLRQGTTPYIVNCDDDFVFTPETRVDRLADILDHDASIGLASGLVRMDGRTAQTWNGHFSFVGEGANRLLRMQPLSSPWETLNGVWYRRTDLTWNFYCARRETVLGCADDPNFKICGEHLDRFLSFHRDGVKIVESPNVIIGHIHYKPPAYVPFRQRTQKFYAPMIKKWGIAAPPNHPASSMPGVEIRDVMQMVRDQHRERPNLVLLTVGHTGSTIAAKILGALGWDLGDADEEYGESVSVRDANQRRDWSSAAEILAAMPEPWVIKDPRFCEHIDRWLPSFERYSPTLVWLTRDEDATAESFRRRGESLELFRRRIAAAESHFERWTGPKIKVDYSQLQAAISMWRQADEGSVFVNHG